MGQWDVYEWLKCKYECGIYTWFTPKDVEQGLREQGFTNGYLINIRTDLIKLSVANCIEYKDLDKTGLSNYKKVFRYKKANKNEI